MQCLIRLKLIGLDKKSLFCIYEARLNGGGGVNSGEDCVRLIFQVQWGWLMRKSCLYQRSWFLTTWKSNSAIVGKYVINALRLWNYWQT